MALLAGDSLRPRNWAWQLASHNYEDARWKNAVRFATGFEARDGNEVGIWQDEANLHGPPAPAPRINRPTRWLPPANA